MEGDSSPPATTVPIKTTEPEDHAPPTLAEPASGPVAEMSGALKDSMAPMDDIVENVIAPAEPPSTNGISEAPPQPQAAEPEKPAEPSSVSHEPAATVEDAEMKDDLPFAGQTAEETAADANGASSGRRATNGKRKSTGGIPEHKSKKLNKKKSMPKITHLDAEPGDLFFARLKSYPPWPSIICDEEMLPTSLLSTRPVTTKREDGTYREPYADGGKKVAERTFAVMFLHTNEFAWIPNTDLADLNPEDCKDVAEKGKSKALIAAYKVAAEEHGLQHFKDVLAEHASALQADQEMKEARVAEKAAKAGRRKSKSEPKAVEEDEDVDMEDLDEVPEKKKSSKKRKKEVESDDEEVEKPPKTPKTKLKLTTGKTPKTEEKKGKKPKEKAEKPKKERKAKKPVDSNEEMVDAESKEPEKVVDPVEERKAREKEVLFLRHKLQKGFLSRDQAPQEDEMSQMSNYIKKLEVYDELEVGIIRTTKINKVLKAIVKLNTIPKDEEFNIRARSMELLSKMNKLLGGSDDAEPATSALTKDEPTTNGVGRDDEKLEPAQSTPVPPAEPEQPTETGATKPSETAAAAPTTEDVAPMMDTAQETTPAEPVSAPVPAPVASVVSEPADGAAEIEGVVPEPAKVETAEPTPAPVAADATDITTATE